MEKEQIIAALREVVKPHLEYQSDEVVNGMNEETNLLQELGLDSVDLVEVIMDIEERFSIAIADEEIQRVKTVRDLTALISAKL